MKLLVVTQKVAKNDPILGFFHRWLDEFAKNFEKVTVICLEEGQHDLPQNVKVLSLGKERKKSVINYIINFYKYIWKERGNYDAVFVHMNQEYVILGWKSWWLMGKPIYLWRNHAEGNFWTRLAVLFSKKVFYTSPQSFTARFKKAVQMPVGIDADFFKPDPNIIREKNSALFLGRISPVKKVLEFIDWVKENNYSATIAGPILPEDKRYGEKVLKKLGNNIKYVGPVDQYEARKLYQTHEVYVNFTSAGSFDKTIFEALASGCKLIVDNPDAKNIVVEDHSLNKLFQKLVEVMK